MLVLKAQLTIRPDARAAFLDFLRDLADASRAEYGCINFMCCEDVIEPDSFIVLQEWEDEGSLAQHEASAHVAQFKVSTGRMIVSRQPTRVYTVSSVGGL
jgi:quinol monooxygenase YgiN